jgi:hypothetical protein
MNQSTVTHRHNIRGALHCGAKTRDGMVCERRPIPGRTRCRLHGGLSPGASRGPRNGNFKDGSWTKEALEERRWLRSLINAFAKAEGAS